MHPVRRNILIRWVGYVAVVVGMGTWIYLGGHQAPEFKSTVMQRLAPGEVTLPSDEVTTSIQSAISVLRGEKAAFASVDTIEQSLIRQRPGLEGGPGQPGMPGVRISALFMGPPDKFAILNGVVYKEGALLADGRTLKTIKRDGVVLAMGDSVQDVPWVHPFRVALTKPEKEKSTVFRPDQADAEGEGAQGAGAGATGQQVDVDNLPPDLTPDQALKILQSAGSQ